MKSDVILQFHNLYLACRDILKQSLLLSYAHCCVVFTITLFQGKCVSFRLHKSPVAHSLYNNCHSLYYLVICMLPSTHMQTEQPINLLTNFTVTLPFRQETVDGWHRGEQRDRFCLQGN